MPLTKQDRFVPNTFVMDTICSWLSSVPIYKPEASEEKTQAILDNILLKSGLTKPYTREQRAINSMLLTNHADAQTCQATWAFYNDYNHASF